MSQITMKEIAIRAGISRPNVSKILNNKPVMVSTGTREKVLQIARELNYTPNYFARTLKTGKTNCIGVSILTNGRDFFTRFNDNYLSNVYSGLGAAIKANAIKMLFHEVNEHKESMELANKRMVDGMIFVLFSDAIRDFPKIKAEVLSGMNIPYVIISSVDYDLGCNCIGLHAHHGGVTATQHLIKHGYQSIGCVKFTKDNIPHSNDFFKGYQETLAQHNMTCDEKFIYYVDGYDSRLGYQLAGKMLESKTMPQALFVLSDLIAHGMIKKFIQAGVRVPEDIALFSYGDEVYIYNEFCELSIIKQPAFEKGYLAGKLLLQLMQNSVEAATPRQIALDMDLVLRRSCGCNKDNWEPWGEFPLTNGYPNFGRLDNYLKKDKE